MGLQSYIKLWMYKNVHLDNYHSDASIFYTKLTTLSLLISLSMWMIFWLGALLPNRLFFINSTYFCTRNSQRSCPSSSKEHLQLSSEMTSKFCQSYILKIAKSLTFQTLVLPRAIVYKNHTTTWATVNKLLQNYK